MDSQIYIKSIEYDWHINAQTLTFTNEMTLLSILSSDETCTRFLMKDLLTQSIHWLEVYTVENQDRMEILPNDRIWHTSNYIYKIST